MENVKINILGTEYTINKRDYKDVPLFEKRGIDGYCDAVAKEIILCDLTTHPALADDPMSSRLLEERQVLRHEIIHAFLNESGLRESSGTPSQGWAVNEEMVDWIALQFPKISKVFEELKIL